MGLVNGLTNNLLTRIGKQMNVDINSPFTQAQFDSKELGPHIANKDNAAKLILWLRAGAPHTTFNLDQIIVPVTPHYRYRMVDQEIPDTCGTACCIAGAAQQMGDGSFGAVNWAAGDVPATEWPGVETSAFAFLGMAEITEDYSAQFTDPAEDEFGMFPIFDPECFGYAMDEVLLDGPVTGQMAADALFYYSWTSAPMEAVSWATEQAAELAE